MINKIFIQNASAGAAIKRVDRNNEDTSGPKINLPPKKNLCVIQTTVTVNSSSYRSFKFNQNIKKIHPFPSKFKNFSVEHIIEHMNCDYQN